MTESFITFTTPTRSNSMFNMNPELIQIRKQIANAVMLNKDHIYINCPSGPNYYSIEKQLHSEGYHVSDIFMCFKKKWKISWE